MLNEAQYISHKIWNDSVITLSVKCPYCNNTNHHTITTEYNANIIGMSRICDNIYCLTNNGQYILPDWNHYNIIKECAHKKK